MAYYHIHDRDLAGPGLHCQNLIKIIVRFDIEYSELLMTMITGWFVKKTSLTADLAATFMGGSSSLVITQIYLIGENGPIKYGISVKLMWVTMIINMAISKQMMWIFWYEKLEKKRCL